MNDKTPNGMKATALAAACAATSASAGALLTYGLRGAEPPTVLQGASAGLGIGLAVTATALGAAALDLIFGEAATPAPKETKK